MKGREPLPLPWAPTGKMRYRIVDAGVVRQTADKMVTKGGLEEGRVAPGTMFGREGREW
jgi:hypothetical protein